jgi:cysteine desulfurase
MRSGTLPVPLIVGLGWAAQLAVEGLAVEVPRLRALRARLWTGLKAIGGVHLNGPDLSDRAANNLNLSFDNVEAEALIMAIRDIAVSTGSACTSATLEPSHVLRALGVSDTLAHSSLRMGLGRFTTEGDIDHVIARLNEEVPRLRAMSTLYAPGA